MNDIHSFSFANINLPKPTESRNTSESTFVNWGLDNLYPNFLLGLYADSAIHSAIINQKTTYVIGAGFKLNGEDYNPNVNPEDSLQELTSKLTKDYLLFNSFAVEVNFNTFGQPVQFFHIPIHKLRMNKSKTKFWFCEDWSYTRKSIQYDRYNPKEEQDGTSKIFYFDGFFPSINNVYPTAEYAGSIKSIVTDIAIKDFNLNNIKNHFSPSTIITFFNGDTLNDTGKQAVISSLNREYKGENGNKLIVSFQSKDGKEADVKSIGANDWDKAYTQVSEANINDIQLGHQIQSPLLFGIKTAGSLGNAQELETAYEIFKNNYVEVKRNEIASALNQLFVNTDIQKLQFEDRPLFATQLSETVKTQILTINELREIAGFSKIADGDRLINQTSAPTPTVQQEVKKKLTEDDFEQIKHLGEDANLYEIVAELEDDQFFKFDRREEIAKYVIDNDIKYLTVEQTVDVLKKAGIETSAGELNSILGELEDDGIIKVKRTGDIIQILPNPTPDLPQTEPISVMYKYVKRSGVPGGDLLPTSRGFCVKLINNNRLYTRADIQGMSELFGYDIFKFTGGFYHNPETGETTSYCRHKWQAVQVRKRS
ncbi:MAG: phage portal protein [Bacteroidetes bacterium]|nr:phage portal protein [Bacteroidota bacterium]